MLHTLIIVLMAVSGTLLLVFMALAALKLWRQFQYRVPYDLEEFLLANIDHT